MNTSPRYHHKPFERLFILGGVALAAMTWIGCSGATADGEKQAAVLARPVKTLVVSRQSVNEIRSFPGIVNAAREIDLAFRVGGPLVDFDVKIGQRVEKGAVIARIDPRDFNIRIQRLSAALAEARANLKAMKTGARAEDIARIEAELTAARSRRTEAERNFVRQQNLLKDRAIARSVYDNAKTALDTARSSVDVVVQQLKIAKTGARAEDIEAVEAKIDALSADLSAARNALADTRLKAPFGGYINRKFVENYENVKSGSPIISLLDFSSVEIRTAIPEDLVIRKADFAAIDCTLDAYPDQHFAGNIKEIGRKTDSANQSYPLTVVLDIPAGRVVEPGMAATVGISIASTGPRREGFILPSSAVFADGDGTTCLWRVDPDTLRVKKLRVTTGPLHSDSIHILSDLEDGTRIVVAGARFLRENQPIRLLDKVGEDRQ